MQIYISQFNGLTLLDNIELSYEKYLTDSHVFPCVFAKLIFFCFYQNGKGRKGHWSLILFHVARPAYAPWRMVTITTPFWLTKLSRGQTWRFCFEGRKWGGVRWEVLKFLQTNMKFSDFLQTWGVLLKMRRRHKQGNFWWLCTFLACPGAVRRFAELSRDCASLWLIVGCHRVNSNFNLSHAVDFNSSAFCGRFRLKTEISDSIFVLLIF